MLNKRKALIGWIVYTVGKPIAKRALKSKARSATPGKRGGAITGAVAGIGAAAVGALMFWRKRRSSDESATSS
jgi:hypothetical protein